MADETTEAPADEKPADEPIKPDQVTGPDGQVFVTPDETDFNPTEREPEYIERPQGQQYTWEQLTALSTQMSKSRLLPDVYRGHPENVMVMAVMAQELGWGLTTAMRFVHVIEGKPTVSPEGMLALVRRAGHSVQGEADSKAASIRGKRGDNGDEMWVRFTIADAQTAKLTGKDNWVKYPDAMLWARALGMLCRRLFSDVLLGAAYTPDEMGAVTDEKGEPIYTDSNVVRGIDWRSLGWKDEADMNAHRAETKVIMDALNPEARAEVRRLAGPMPDLADYSIGVWNRRHSVLLDIAGKAGIVDDDGKLLPQFEAAAEGEASDTPTSTSVEAVEVGPENEPETDVCLYCDSIVPVAEFDDHVAQCEAAEKDTVELPDPGAFDLGGYS